jgi:prolipoprotein diacylglyceryl transferase
MTALLTIPSPAQAVWQLGPIPLRAYAVCVLTGIIVAAIGTWRRWRARGGDTERLESLLLVTVVAGIIGARLYFVIIEWPRYFGPNGVWYHVFFVWQGGLGIMGGVAIGALAAWLMCRHYQLRFLVLADCIAVMLPVAQAIGRLGNYWNQELYGQPTDLSWGLEIDLAHRVPGFESYATFHPTFLYEMIWNLSLAALLWLLERGINLGRGKVFAIYLIGYAFGRFVIESFRIDPVEVIAGLRVNSWVALAVGLIGLVWLTYLIFRHPGGNGPTSARSASATPARAMLSDQGDQPDSQATEATEGTEATEATDGTEAPETEAGETEAGETEAGEAADLAGSVDPADQASSPTPEVSTESG